MVKLQILLLAVVWVKYTSTELVAFDWRRLNDARKFCIGFKADEGSGEMKAIIKIHSSSDVEYCCQHLVFDYIEGRLMANVGKQKLHFCPGRKENNGEKIYLQQGPCKSKFKYDNGSLFKGGNASLCVGSVLEDVCLLACENVLSEDWYLFKVDCKLGVSSLSESSNTRFSLPRAYMSETTHQDEMSEYSAEHKEETSVQSHPFNAKSVMDRLDSNIVQYSVPKDVTTSQTSSHKLVFTSEFQNPKTAFSNSSLTKNEHMYSTSVAKLHTLPSSSLNDTEKLFMSFHALENRDDTVLNIKPSSSDWIDISSTQQSLSTPRLTKSNIYINFSSKSKSSSETSNYSQRNTIWSPERMFKWEQPHLDQTRQFPYANLNDIDTPENGNVSPSLQSKLSTDSFSLVKRTYATVYKPTNKKRLELKDPSSEVHSTSIVNNDGNWTESVQFSIETSKYKSLA